MGRRAIVFASIVFALSFLIALGYSGIDKAHAAGKSAELTQEGLLAPAIGFKATNYGYRANEGGGGSLDTEWVTGALGNTWAEGEWVPYQLIISGLTPGWPGLDSVMISWDFNVPHGGDFYRFIDLVRGIQVSTVPLNDAEAWPDAGGNAMPVGTRAELETAQNSPNEYVWTGFTFLNLPNEQVNRTLDGGLDVPPGEERHMFKVYKSDLLAAGIDSSATTVVIYYQLHESRTFVWANSLQSGYDTPPTDVWGGYLYGTDGWPTALGIVGSGFVPGASGHVHIENLGGSQDVGVPIPEPLPGVVSGVKWLDADGDSVYDGGETTLPGWEIHIFGNVEGVDFNTSVLTDGSGYYSFSNLAVGTTWLIKEDSQRDVPLELGYSQTYPSVGTVQGLGTGVAVSPPPSDAAPVGWEVEMLLDSAEQMNLNFGNKGLSVAVLCPGDVTVECDESTDPSNTGEATAGGSCGSIEITYSDTVIPGSCPESYTIERTWTATCLANGETDSCIQTITVVDTTAPYFVTPCPADATVECDGVPEPPPMTAEDNCDPDVEVVFSEVRTDGSCPDSYTLTRTWVATDDCGNSTTCEQTLTVADTTPPVLTLPPDATFECDAIGDAGTATAVDNCDLDPEVSYEDNTLPGECPQAYTIERTWTAVDDCDNSRSGVQYIYIQDTTPPEITCPVDATFECDAIGDAGAATATDNCDPEPTLGYEDNVVPGSCPEAYTIERTWTATDACGNASSCVQYIYVEDTTDPYFVTPCPGDATVECDAVPPPALMEAADACDPVVDVTYDEQQIPGDCTENYTLVRTWTATDDCGNAATCEQTLTVVDTTPPEITCPGDRTFECDVIGDFGVATASDNCDPEPAVDYEDNTIPGDCPQTYTIERTWTATDACGNAASCVQYIYIEDTTPPYFTAPCPPDDTVECDNIPSPPTMTAEDNCDTDVEVVWEDEIIPGGYPQGYTIVWTWTATDDCGNQAVCEQRLNVVDRTPPEITCPGDIGMECNESLDTGVATAVDNCDLDPAVDYVDDIIPGRCPQAYTVERTWTATDDAGNQSSCVQYIYVDDTMPPYFVTPLPADVTVECDAVPAPAVLDAEDGCDPDVEVIFDEDQSPGPCPQSYTIRRSWTAADDCGNQEVHEQFITVVDTTPPYWVSVCPDDGTVECNQVPMPPPMEAMDNCDTDVYVEYREDELPGPCPYEYTLVRTWTATDDCGNDTVCEQVLTVIDATAPEITCPADIMFECDNIGDAGRATATDNCDMDPEIRSEDNTVPGSCPQAYTIERLWIATDACGNADSCMQYIYVEDRTDPYFTTPCPGDDIVECDNIPGPPLMYAADACDPDVEVTFDEEIVPGIPPTYDIVRTWTATDDCGNDTVCEQVLTVVDTTPPEITCPPEVTYECDDIGDGGVATAEDNCDPDPFVDHDDYIIPGPCPQTYTIERTWTAMDNAGNMASCIQLIHVEDTTPPYFVTPCPGDATVECDAVPDPAAMGAEDNCDPDVFVEYREEELPGSCPDSYTLVRTWTAIDDCENEIRCEQVLTVVDTTDPYFVTPCPGDVTVECDAVPGPAFMEAADNCDTDVDVDFLEEQFSGDCPYSYTLVRTWTATDDCGNETRCEQTVTVEDSTPPELTCPADETFECDDIGYAGEATAVDNCDPDPVVSSVDNIVGGPCPQTYTIERTWTAADACGNASSCVQLINIEDTTPPFFVTECPADAVVECDNVQDPPTMLAEDNCDEDVDVTFEEERIDGSSQEYTLVRTWTATDDCENSTVCEQVLTVVDTTPPEIVCPDGATFECDETVVFGFPIVADNCDLDPVVTFSDLTIPSDCAHTYTIERTWTATDATGNSSSCVQVVMVEDTTPPTLVCSPDDSIGCNQAVVFTEPVASDNCDPAPSVEITSYEVSPGDLPCQEVHVKTWVAVDACGNRSTPCSQAIVRTVDSEAPVLTGAEDLRLACNAAVEFTEPGVTDNCDPAPIVEIQSTTIEPGPGLCDETHIRCWIARDACGNVSEQVCQVIVRMVDTESPVLICAPDKTVPFGSPVIFDEPEITDNCMVTGELEALPSFTQTDAEGQETFTQCWIILDECDNVSNECCQTITVEAEPDPYCTFACWDWGTTCLPGDNEDISTKPACIRDTYFYDVFPEGVVIGDPSRYTATWTSPEAVEAFGCGYGIPWPLRRNYVDPERNELGVLAGEILALRLNREFSCAGHLSSLGYGPDACYGQFVIPDSVLYFGGLTVDQFLEVADQGVAGNTAAVRAYGANIDHLWATATYLNWLYSSCNGQFIQSAAPTGPPDDPEDEDTGEPVSEVLPERMELTVRPNPLDAGTRISLALPKDADVSMDIYDVQGRKVRTLMSGHLSAGYHATDWNGSDEHGNRVGAGVYFCRLRVNGRPMLMQKLMKL